MPIWVGVLTIWKITVISVCLMFAWRTRLVSVPCLNDTACIISAIFVVMVIVICATMAMPTLRYSQTASFIILNIAITLCVILYQTLLFLPKVRYWWKTPDDVSPRISTSSLKELASAELPTFPAGCRADKPPYTDGKIPDISHYPEGDLNGNIFTDDCLLDIVEENKKLKESLCEKEILITDLQGHLDRAKDNLSKFPSRFDVPLKHDSGLEADASADAPDDVYDELRSPDPHQDRSEAYRVDFTTKSDNTKDMNETHSRPKPIYVETQSYQSNESVASFVAEFTDIRNSIAAELEGASFINADLKNSLDMERPYSETEWLYQSNAAPELAGSIAQSYNLGDNSDMYSYIQAHLPRDNNVIQVRRSRRLSSSSIRSMPSSETMSGRSAEIDNISFDLPNLSRDSASATPNSQQHAAILRYYSYRHMSDGLKRFNTYRINRDYRFKRNTSSNGSQKSNSYRGMPQEGAISVYSTPHVPPIPPKLFKDAHVAKDSFV
ncbi:hypothetical protein ACF0H5_011626 [Mactra antiquata]